MATYRERREAKVAKLREWSGKRATKAVAAASAAQRIARLMWTVSISRRGCLEIAAGSVDRFHALARLFRALDSAEDGAVVELSRVHGERFEVVAWWQGGAAYDVAEVYDVLRAS